VKRLREFLPNLQVKVLLQLEAIPRNKMDKVVRNELQTLAKEHNV
jgi:acyl-coenzyme A synthetase/AMP-(fatty) acid ligase